MNGIANRPEIATEAVCRIVVKAREFAAKEDVVEAEPGSNPVDEELRQVLADYPDDPVYDELKSFIDDMDVDAQCELVALLWVGRGDFRPDQWGQALALARQEHTEHTAEYLLGTPLLADYLEEGLGQFGLSCLDFEKHHL
ncbi:MAG TPA: DUF3775 domain-containing protein [Woeseiaceae bacterium]|jgi:hypothetical protein|nr:DUF3775 domain-containing protein [Woeseiaceae bacterium]